MGDILHALPAVTALRQLHPSWTIDWVVEPAWQPLLTTGNGAAAEPLSAAQPLVNRRAISRRPRPGPATRSVSPLSVKSAHCAGHLWLAVTTPCSTFQGAVRSALIARAAGSSRIVGEAHPRETPAKWFFSERVATRGRHVIEQDIELAAAVSRRQAFFPPAAAAAGSRSPRHGATG